MRRILAASCVILMATGCGSDSEDGGAATSAAPGPATSTAPADATPTDPLEGRWQSDTVTRRMVTRHLTDAGLRRAVTTVLEDQGYPTSFTLTMTDARYQIANADGDIYDEGSYEVQDKQITLTAAATGAGPTFAWSLADDVLDLQFVSSTGTPYKGLPDEAFARPLYDVPTFTRTP